MTNNDLIECFKILGPLPEKTHYFNEVCLEEDDLKNIYVPQQETESENGQKGTSSHYPYHDKAYISYHLHYLSTDSEDPQLWHIFIRFRIPSYLMSPTIYHYIDKLAGMLGIASPDGHFSYGESECAYANYVLFTKFYVYSYHFPILPPYFNDVIRMSPEIFHPLPVHYLYW